MKRKIVSAAEAAAKIPDGAVVAMSGVGIYDGIAQEVIDAVVARYEQEQHPSGISLVHSGGNMVANAFSKEGMLSAYYSGLPMIESDILTANTYPAYSLTQGIVQHLYRGQASDTPYVTKIGLGTFIDPRIEAGAINALATENPIVKLIVIDDEEYLYYKIPPITVSIIRATTADADGNLTSEQEVMKNELLYMAMAARNNGGIVIAQVKYIAETGSLKAADVKVPGMLVDYVVSCTNHDKLHGPPMNAPFSLGMTGYHRVPDYMVPLKLYAPDGDRLLAARRAVTELRPGCVANVGIGMGEGVSYLASKEGLKDMFYLTNELGAVSGHIGGKFFFGSSFNAYAYMNHPEMFDFINGHGLDMSFLGAAEIGEDGSVNVTKINGKIKGSGGFVNISSSTPKIVFLSSFTIGGKNVIENGELKIIEPGRGGKFLKSVDQISFSGPDAAKRGQEILYITERAVFKLIDGKVTLIEYASGLDVQKDILGFMDFVPAISPDLKTMPAYCFEGGPIGLKEEWKKQL